MQHWGFLLQKEKIVRVKIEVGTGAQRDNDISFLKGFQNSSGQPAVALKGPCCEQLVVNKGETPSSKGEIKVARFYQEDAMANGS